MDLTVLIRPPLQAVFSERLKPWINSTQAQTALKRHRKQVFIYLLACLYASIHILISSLRELALVGEAALVPDKKIIRTIFM